MPRIVIGAKGLSVVGEKKAKTAWTSIAEIVAYKVDLWSYDIICVGIRVRESEDFIELEERWEGFRQLIAALEERFDIPRDWWSKVSYPAFAENRAILWSRSKNLIQIR